MSDHNDPPELNWDKLGEHFAKLGAPWPQFADQKATKRKPLNVAKAIKAERKSK